MFIVWEMRLHGKWLNYYPKGTKTKHSHSSSTTTNVQCDAKVRIIVRNWTRENVLHLNIISSWRSKDQSLTNKLKETRERSWSMRLKSETQPRKHIELRKNIANLFQFFFLRVSRSIRNARCHFACKQLEKRLSYLFICLKHLKLQRKQPKRKQTSRNNKM